MKKYINGYNVRKISLGIGTILFLSVTLAMSSAGAIDPGEKNARNIVQAVLDRDTGNRQVARVLMTLTDASGRERQRVLQTRTLDFEGGTKTLMLFESPSDVRNTGLLTIDYNGAKDDDLWLYLPSLRKTTRISSSGKSGSFVGTDITYADMTKKDINAYTYTLLKESVDLDGESCWLIESRPKTAKEAESTGYLKTQSWISKSKLMPLQAKMWVRKGRN